MQCRWCCRLLLSIASIMGGPALADVYQCQQQGVVMFSQFPCENAQSVQLEVKSGVLIPSRSADTQLDTLRKKSRFLEYQHLVVLQQKNQQLRQLQHDLYRAKRRGDASDYLVLMQQRAQKMEQDLRLLETQQLTEQLVLQQQISQLERQYVAQ